MVTAIILISVERDLILDVIDEILKVDGIMEVHSVAGEYDLAAIARVEDNQQLSMILAFFISPIPYTSSSLSGSLSRISNVLSPNFSTILTARAGPIPLIAPDER